MSEQPALNRLEAETLLRKFIRAARMTADQHDLMHFALDTVMKPDPETQDAAPEPEHT